jgi:hypothetical protein
MSGREYYSPVAEAPDVTAKCLLPRDLFWIRACVVLCVVLLLIIVFQLNRLNRLLAKRTGG